MIILAVIASIIAILIIIGLIVLFGLLFGSTKTAQTIRNLKNYGDRCSSIDDCFSDRNLICSNGICTCLSTMYYNMSACTNKKLYNSSCTTNECDDTKNLFCISAYCTCKNNYIYDGEQCLKGYMDPCRFTSQCYGNLVCLNSFCDCNLPITKKMNYLRFWNTQNCSLYPLNCKEIKQNQPTAPSGIYYIGTKNGVLEVYCEMVIDGGGYTFFPWTSLTKNNDRLFFVYNDTTKVLFRIIDRSDFTRQPYILTTQLNNYSQIPIGVFENDYTGYTKPSANSTPYVYIGYLPLSISKQRGAVQGLAGNGQQINFINCDGNPNSYIILFQNLNPTDSTPNINYVLVDQWKASALNHPSNTYMPTEYFYYMEIGMGGCGASQRSNRWTDYFGVAFGLK